MSDAVTAYYQREAERQWVSKWTDLQREMERVGQKFTGHIGPMPPSLPKPEVANPVPITPDRPIEASHYENNEWIKDEKYNEWLRTFVERNPRAPQPTEPPSGYIVQFRDHVGPCIRNLIHAQATCIANGVETWEGGIRAVIEYAAQHGADRLPDEHWEALERWVMSTLSEEITVAEAGTHNRQSTVWNWILRGDSAGSE